MELDFIRPAPFFFQDAAYLTVTVKAATVKVSTTVKMEG